MKVKTSLMLEKYQLADLFRVSRVVISLILSSKSYAHEFWLEPVHFSIQPQDEIFVHEKVGQDFKGNEYAYLPSSYVSFELIENDISRPVSSEIGDRPAVSEKVNQSGLLILVAETTASTLIYETADKFNAFLENQGLNWVKQKHKNRGLPEKGFTESYRRFAKTVIKVGHGKGADRLMGLPIEWVLESNPYTDYGAVKARLFLNGKPMLNKKITIFNRIFTDDEKLLENTRLIKTSLKTDQQGMVEIPKENGGLFLISAAHMVKPSDQTEKETGAVWESLWASMTYEIIKMK